MVAPSLMGPQGDEGKGGLKTESMQVHMVCESVAALHTTL